MAVLFPVGAKSAAAPPASRPASTLHPHVGPAFKPKGRPTVNSMHSAIAEPLARQQLPGVDPFRSLSHQGSFLAGMLFKAAILLVSLPLAGYIITEHVFVGLCIKGLQARGSEVVEISLRRIPKLLRYNFLAANFDAADGVTLFMRVTDRRLGSDGVQAWLLALRHLMQYPSTRDALLMSQVVERLEKAFQGGWFPEEHLPLAREVYLDAHNMRRLALEEAYGGADVVPESARAPATAAAIAGQVAPPSSSQAAPTAVAAGAVPPASRR